MVRKRTLGRLFPAVFWLCAATLSAAQTALPSLHDGEAFIVRGKLKIVYAGWHRSLVLPLEHPYLADFGPDEGTREITALELNPQGHDATIAEHAGEILEAQGKLQLESVSPHDWNGVMLMASTVRLPDGTTLRPERSQPLAPASTELYAVTIAMVPHEIEWRREARDIETGDPLPDPALDGCSLNGGGDIMNCICIPGFVPVRAGVVAHPLPPTRWRAIPFSGYTLPGVAQVSLPDPTGSHPQIVEIACKRKGLSHK